MSDATYHRLVLTWLRDPDAFEAARRHLAPVLRRHHQVSVLTVRPTSVEPTQRALPDFATIVRYPGQSAFRALLADPDFRRRRGLLEHGAHELALGGTAAIGDPRLLSRARLTLEIGWPVVAFSSADPEEHTAFSMHVSLMDDGRGSTYLPGPSAYVRVLARPDPDGAGRVDDVEVVWRLAGAEPSAPPAPPSGPDGAELTSL